MSEVPKFTPKKEDEQRGVRRAEGETFQMLIGLLESYLRTNNWSAATVLSNAEAMTILTKIIQKNPRFAEMTEFDVTEALHKINEA